MVYSKGDIIKLKSGILGLVLNDGIKGKEFVEQYGGNEILYFNMFDRPIGWIVGVTWKWSPNSTKEEIWYYILVGDQKAWIEMRRLKQHKG